MSLFRIARNIVLYYLVRRVLGFLVFLAIAAFFLSRAGAGGSGVLDHVWGAATRGLSSVVSSAHAESGELSRRGLAAGAVPASHSVPAGSSFTVGFSPGNAEPLVVAAVDQARRSIDVAAYSFTSRPVAAALIRAAERGVAVRVVMDKSQRSERYSKATFLMHAGIPVRIDDRYAIMHNKFMVIDAETVETGSFNFTASAAVRNAENVLVLHDMPQLADSYSSEWKRLWGESIPFVSRD